MNTQQKRFEYKLILCYLRAAWLRVVKFFGYRPQRMGKGGEWKKDSQQSEPIGDGNNLSVLFGKNYSHLKAEVKQAYYLTIVAIVINSLSLLITILRMI